MTADTPREPVTEAGQFLLNGLLLTFTDSEMDARELILAIEAEARAAGLREARQAVEALPWTGFYEGGVIPALLASVRAAVLAVLAAPGAAPAEPATEGERL